MSRTSPLQTAIALVLAAATLATVPAAAQGLPTATLRGHVTNEGQGVPGVSVALKSPSLQGTRTLFTSGSGDYAVVNLPPGVYTATFAISGFQTLTKSVSLFANQAATLDAVLNLTGVEVTVTAVARAEQISETAQDSTTFSSDIMNKLPVARTMASAVNLTPGVNANGPNGAFTISGAQSAENLYTVNGVVITDNIRGTPNNLFIEDAVQETTTTTASVSAEYGRFQGGVINTITKSGGNRFSGSLRVTLNNDAWSAYTPADDPEVSPKVQSLTPSYEATFGGPIWTDRIWFFGAARIPKTTERASLTAPDPHDGNAGGVPYVYTDLEKRYEGKLTITPIQNHTLMGSYIRIDQSQGNYGWNFIDYPWYDLDSVYDRQLPQELITANYNGVLTDKLFVEAQYSKRKFAFENSGSRYMDLVKGTPFYEQYNGGVWNSPIFCGVCPGATETRNNEDIIVKGNYLISSPKLGSHNIVLGFDDFAGKVVSNNYQSGSNYFINATDVIFQNGQIYPVLDSSSYLGYYPIPRLAQASDTRTYSVFLNDQGKIGENFSFNLGVRWDKNRAEDSSGAVTANDSYFSPRLAATWSPSGNLRFNVSYAKYVGGIQENAAGAATKSGAPAAYWYGWGGPDINTDPTGTLTSSRQAIEQVFAWYGITAPGQFPTNPDTPFWGASIPGLNSVIPNSLDSPNTDEFSLGVAGQLGTRGSWRADGVYRNAHRFYSTRTDLTTGIATDEFGNEYDIGVVENLDDPLVRKYYGLTLQVAYRLGEGLNVGGNWTWSHAYGNHEGETSGSGPVTSGAMAYPEYRQQRWNFPTGDLSQDQRHKIRLYATYDLPLPKSVGVLTASLLESYDTGTPYGAVGKVNSEIYVTNPGYATPPAGNSSPTYYYTARDAYRTDNINRTDLALNYSKNLGPVEVFVQPQVLNVFNSHGVINVNTSVVSSVNSSSMDDFDPFTTAPVQGVNWQKGSNFGQAVSPTDYQPPRVFRITMGIRF